MPFYSEDVIEQVKSSNDIIDVISSYVTLKRRGDTYFGLCPFHKEKTGSFAASRDKQIYHCFGCGEGGNVIRFIMKIENIGFKEAVDFLANRANIILPTVDTFSLNQSQSEIIKREEAKKQMYEINRFAGRFFYENIFKSPIAQKYIESRKISIDTVKKFGLGFSLDDNGLSKMLVSKGFNEENIIATGLVGKSESGYLYDKFKNRFMFPIFDVTNRVVAFGGRTLLDSETMKKEKVPKYVNSPENLIYTKGRHLYGLNIAKKNNDKIKKLLVVEGYMDVISPHQVGFTNVVASLGTALTEKQGRLLAQYAEEIVLSYDSDEAGQKAIVRGIEILQALNVQARVLQMDNAKDPDEYVLKFGKEKFEKLVNNSISATEYKVRELQKQYNLEDISEKIKFLSKISEILSKVESNIERDIYVDKFSLELGVGREAILAEIEKIIFKKDKKILGEVIKPNVDLLNQEKSISELENMIIFLLLQKDLSTYLKISDVIKIEDINSSQNKAIISKLYGMYENGDINTKDIMSICETDEENSFLSELLLKQTSKEDIDKLTDDIIRKIEIERLQEEKIALIKKIQLVNNDDERKLLEEALNDVIIKIAKK